MNKLKSAERDIREYLRSGDKNFVGAYQDVIHHFECFDHINNTNHCKIMKLLYKSPEQNFSYTYIAMKSNVDDRTLLRYRKKYYEYFKYFLERRTNGRAAPEAAATKDFNIDDNM